MSPYCFCLVLAPWLLNSPANSPAMENLKHFTVFKVFLICVWMDPDARSESAGEWIRPCLTHEISCMNFWLKIQSFFHFCLNFPGKTTCFDRIQRFGRLCLKTKTSWFEKCYCSPRLTLSSGCLLVLFCKAEAAYHLWHYAMIFPLWRECWK